MFLPLFPWLVANLLVKKRDWQVEASWSKDVRLSWMPWLVQWEDLGAFFFPRCFGQHQEEALSPLRFVRKNYKWNEVNHGGRMQYSYNFSACRFWQDSAGLRKPGISDRGGAPIDGSFIHESQTTPCDIHNEPWDNMSLLDFLAVFNGEKMINHGLAWVIHHFPFCCAPGPLPFRGDAALRDVVDRPLALMFGPWHFTANHVLIRIYPLVN